MINLLVKQQAQVIRIIVKNELTTWPAAFEVKC